MFDLSCWTSFVREISLVDLVFGLALEDEKMEMRCWCHLAI